MDGGAFEFAAIELLNGALQVVGGLELDEARHLSVLFLQRNLTAVSTHSLCLRGLAQSRSRPRQVVQSCGRSLSDPASCECCPLSALYRIADLPAGLGCEARKVHSVDGTTWSGNIAVGGAEVVLSSRASSELDSEAFAFELGAILGVSGVERMGRHGHTKC